MSNSFTLEQVKNFLSSDENKVSNDFLQRLKELKIIESIDKENSGEYEFTNRLYFIYFMIVATINDKNIGN